MSKAKKVMPTHPPKAKVRVSNSYSPLRDLADKFDGLSVRSRSLPPPRAQGQAGETVEERLGFLAREHYPGAAGRVTEMLLNLDSATQLRAARSEMELQQHVQAFLEGHTSTPGPPTRRRSLSKTNCAARTGAPTRRVGDVTAGHTNPSPTAATNVHAPTAPGATPPAECAEAGRAARRARDPGPGTAGQTQEGGDVSRGAGTAVPGPHDRRGANPQTDTSHEHEHRRQQLGNQLYPLVQELQPDLASRITGMLAALPYAELEPLFASRAALSGMVDSAMLVLEDSEDGSPPGRPPGPPGGDITSLAEPPLPVNRRTECVLPVGETPPRPVPAPAPPNMVDSAMLVLENSEDGPPPGRPPGPPGDDITGLAEPPLPVDEWTEGALPAGATSPPAPESDATHRVDGTDGGVTGDGDPTVADVLPGEDASRRF